MIKKIFKILRQYYKKLLALLALSLNNESSLSKVTFG